MGQRRLLSVRNHFRRYQQGGLTKRSSFGRAYDRGRKFFKQQILYNRYFETFAELKPACETFFANPEEYRRELRSLLTENFEIVG
jgi:hypothetical protein